ncbi:hypothetical protein L3Q82_003700 [Scortum barcoo]|uniref:Uncharacterized protein n=1 Tax=Scortum barcoo TaxID=214431 RepID=A0ACB8X7S9_9TELE|nr:hypothetical protein L3Q82_003700 [Scortum barcoo]
MAVERVSSFKFLGIHISENLSWTANTSSLIKKAHQRLFFLRTLKKNHLSTAIPMGNFYRCAIESILTNCITVWYGNCSVADRKALQRVVKTAQRITKTPLPAIEGRLILLFYLVFYLFLAGMFVLTMYIMLLTLDDYKPTLAGPPGHSRDDDSSEGRSAGDQFLGLRDWKAGTGFIKNLNSFPVPYQVQTNDNCPPDQYFIQEDSGEVRNNPKRSCQFNRTMLEECSGISDRYYGYNRGQPCILIKLNRVIGMLPGKDGQSPYVTCGAKRYRVEKDEWREDSDKIGPLAYYPPNGTFNLMYYPYYGKKAQVNYTQPLVAVKFLNASLNTGHQRRV